jgi:hypothetical protein
MSDFVVSDQWSIRTGGYLEFGAIAGVELRMIYFHNLKVNEERPFIMLNATLGAKLGFSGNIAGEHAAQAAARGAEKLVKTMAKTAPSQLAKKTADVLNRGNHARGNPMSSSVEPSAISRPFSFHELDGAFIKGGSIGVDTAVIGGGTAGYWFNEWSNGSSLFFLQSTCLQVTLGLGINIGSAHGGFLVDARPLVDFWSNFKLFAIKKRLDRETSLQEKTRQMGVLWDLKTRGF